MNQHHVIRTEEEITARIAEFCKAVVEFIDSKNAGTPYPFKAVIEADFGKKNCRIVKRERDQTGAIFGGSVFCFIDLENGNILKADGWKRPAKGVRGNIFEENFSIGKGVSEYGAAYLR